MNSIAILLAAGESRRMGSPKALLPWRDRPLLSHQVGQILASRVSECVVVLGREAEQLSQHLDVPRLSTARVHTVINPRPESGRCSSILTGLSSLAARPDAVLIISVDQPVERKLLDALLRAAEEEWDGGETGARRTIVLPTHAGRRGHPPLFHGSLIAELGAIVEESQGLKAVVRRRPERVLEMPWAGPDVLLNLNDPEDLPTAGDDPGRRSSPR